MPPSLASSSSDVSQVSVFPEALVVASAATKMEPTMCYDKKGYKGSRHEGLRKVPQPSQQFLSKLIHAHAGDPKAVM